MQSQINAISPRATYAVLMQLNDSPKSDPRHMEYVTLTENPQKKMMNEIVTNWK